MNNFFRRLSLPVKLILIGLVPLAFIIYLSIILFNEKTKKIALLKGYIHRIHQSANINTLIEVLQNERRYSFAYAIKKNWWEELLAQRPRQTQ